MGGDSMKLELNKDWQIARYDISPEGLGEINIDSSPNGEYVAYEDVSNVLASNQELIGELVEGLERALAVVTDYVEYEHDGDPWTEDARQMGEMGVDYYGRSDQFRADLSLIPKAKALIAKANNK